MTQATPATERQRWAEEIADHVKSLLFALGVDPSDQTPQPPIRTVEILSRHFNAHAVQAAGGRAFYPAGLPPPPYHAFILSEVAAWPKVVGSGEWHDREDRFHEDAIRVLDVMNRTMAAVALLGALADAEVSAAAASKGSKLRVASANRRFFVTCNAIFADATGHKPGGSKDSRTGKVTGPCIRFYSAMLARAGAATPASWLAEAPEFAQVLELTDRAILERIQDAETIRTLRRDQKSDCG